MLQDDYEIVFTTDKKGREKQSLAYRGPYFEIDLDEEILSRIKRQSILMLVMMIALHIGSGFVKNQGMYQLYISIPYIFAFLALWYMASGILRLPTKKRRYRRDEIEHSLKTAKIASKVLMVLLGLGELGEFIFLIFGSEPVKGAAEYLYLALNALTITLLFFSIRLQAKIIIHASPNK